MTFKKNQRVHSTITGSVRIESGPWPDNDDRATMSYLVERVDTSANTGRYYLVGQDFLKPVPPQQGDRGNIKIPAGGHEYYSPYRLVYIDGQVILTENRFGDYDTWQGPQRQQFLDGWEPIDG